MIVTLPVRRFKQGENVMSEVFTNDEQNCLEVASDAGTY